MKSTDKNEPPTNKIVKMVVNTDCIVRELIKITAIIIKAIEKVVIKIEIMKNKRTIKLYATAKLMFNTTLIMKLVIKTRK
ncbi:MAG: hypothetical protein OHM56_04240 [Spiroplasma phoeniceum]|nr:MAG: hypothetical protein OHM56_04240 [Spiroplasma phoeniceum]